MFFPFTPKASNSALILCFELLGITTFPDNSSTFKLPSPFYNQLFFSLWKYRHSYGRFRPVSKTLLSVLHPYYTLHGCRLMHDPAFPVSHSLYHRITKATCYLNSLTLYLYAHLNTLSVYHPITHQTVGMLHHGFPL